MRHAFSYDVVGRVVMSPLGMGPAFSRVEVHPDRVDVRMGWGFSARIPRSSIASVRAGRGRTISRGVHGWRGRWLVNGSSRGMVRLDIEPPVRARVCGIPVRLRELIVSVERPDDLVAALAVQ